MSDILPFPIRAVEPRLDGRDPHKALSFSGTEHLGIWHYPDGTVVIRVGPATEIGAETIALERGQIGRVWRALKAIDEDQNAGEAR